MCVTCTMKIPLSVPRFHGDWRARNVLVSWDRRWSRSELDFAAVIPLICPVARPILNSPARLQGANRMGRV